jgi:hypothetical protein
LVTYLYRVASLVHGADLRQTPAEIVPAIQNLLTRCHGRSVSLLLRPIWQLNYAYLDLRPQLEDALAGLRVQDLLDRFPSGFVILPFPAAERDNVLLHAIFGHELGHGITRSTGIVNDVLASLSPTDYGIANDLLKELPPQEVSPPPDVQRVQTVLHAAVRNWLKELASDTFAIELIGPAYFCAFSFFAMAGIDIEDWSPSHPAARFRLQRMAASDRLRELSTDLGSGVSRYLAYCAQVLGDITPPTELWPRAAFRMLDPLLQVLNSRADSYSEGIGTEPPVPPPQVLGQLLELLRHQVPPSEYRGRGSGRSMPAEFAWVVNCGWEYQLAEMEDLYKLFGARDAVSRFDVRRRFYRLLLKACELGAIASAFDRRGRSGSSRA